MSEGFDTRHSLLLRLGDPNDRGAWEEFTTLYWSVIYRLARKRGLQDADAQDLAQKILMALSRKIGDWKPSGNKGAFRGWLSVVTRNVTLNMLTRRQQDAARGGTSVLAALSNLPGEFDGDREFDLEYRRSVFRIAADEIRNEFQKGTWEAFWLTAVEGLTIAEAGEYLGVSIGSIYAGRSRVMQRLKQKVKEIEAAAEE